MKSLFVGRWRKRRKKTKKKIKSEEENEKLELKKQKEKQRENEGERSVDELTNQPFWTKKRSSFEREKQRGQRTGKHWSVSVTDDSSVMLTNLTPDSDSPPSITFG